MSMSFADGFRTLQAVCDLRVLASRASVETQARIASGIPDGRMAPDVARGAVKALGEGVALDPRLRAETMAAVRLAAALPKDDFAAFLAATAMMLAEALRQPEGEPDCDDDIRWYWQTFRGHYRVAAAVERAAIVQAIRRVGLLRGQTEGLPEAVPDLATAPTAALRPLLERLRPRGLAPPDPSGTPGIAALLVEAFQSHEAADTAARLWQESGERLAVSAPRDILAGFRHLYETRPGWAPASAVPIPLIDPPPGVDWPG